MLRAVAGQRRADPDRLQPPLRRRLRRRPGRRAERRAGQAAHRALDHAGPGPAAGRVHRRLRRHLPGLLRARLRHHPLGDRPRGVEVYAVGGNRGADYIKEAGDADTTGAILTLDDGTIAVVSNSRHNARGYDVRMEIHGFTDSHRRRPGGQAPAALGRARRDLPGGHPARLLHGPLHRRLPRRTHRVHRGRGRHPALALHDRGRPGGGLDRRGGRPVAARAPPRPYRRGAATDGLWSRSAVGDGPDTTRGSWFSPSGVSREGGSTPGRPFAEPAHRAGRPPAGGGAATFLPQPRVLDDVELCQHPVNRQREGAGHLPRRPILRRVGQ